MYINDLSEASKFLKSLFADDITFQASGKTLEELEEFMNTELAKAAHKLHTRKSFFSLYRIKNLLPTKLKVILYNAVFKSHIEYGDNGQESRKSKSSRKDIQALFTKSGFGHTEPIL